MVLLVKINATVVIKNEDYGDGRFVHFFVYNTMVDNWWMIGG